MATVLVVAFTLAVAALVGGWLTSTTQKTTSTIESGLSDQLDCSKGVIDIISVNENGPLIQNMGQVEFSNGLSLACGTNVNTTSENITVGEMYAMTCGTNCTDDGIIIRVASIDCPSVFVECTYGTDCPGN